MRQPVRLVASDRDRLAALEKRADTHDGVLGPMATQVNEMHKLYTLVQNINWFLVKVAAAAGGLLGAAAVVLTIIDKVTHLAGR